MARRPDRADVITRWPLEWGCGPGPTVDRQARPALDEAFRALKALVGDRSTQLPGVVTAFVPALLQVGGYWRPRRPLRKSLGPPKAPDRRALKVQLTSDGANRLPLPMQVEDGLVAGQAAFPAILFGAGRRLQADLWLRLGWTDATVTAALPSAVSGRAR
jgi:hypothetical protein